MDGDMTVVAAIGGALMASLIVGLIGTRARRPACSMRCSTEGPSYRPRGRNLKARDSTGGRRRGRGGHADLELDNGLPSSCTARPMCSKASACSFIEPPVQSVMHSLWKGCLDFSVLATHPRKQVWQARPPHQFFARVDVWHWRRRLERALAGSLDSVTAGAVLLQKCLAHRAPVVRIRDSRPTQDQGQS